MNRIKRQTQQTQDMTNFGHDKPKTATNLINDKPKTMIKIEFDKIIITAVIFIFCPHKKIEVKCTNILYYDGGVYGQFLFCLPILALTQYFFSRGGGEKTPLSNEEHAW